MFKGAKGRVDTEENMALLHKMKQRPMTGAALGSKGAYSKNRRFGPYGGIPSGLNLNGY